MLWICYARFRFFWTCWTKNAQQVEASGVWAYKSIVAGLMCRRAAWHYVVCRLARPGRGSRARSKMRSDWTERWHTDNQRHLVNSSDNAPAATVPAAAHPRHCSAPRWQTTDSTSRDVARPCSDMPRGRQLQILGYSFPVPQLPLRVGGWVDLTT